jgi:hypothetical protein
MEVNLEELDQIIDGGKRAPLRRREAQGGAAHSGRTGEAKVADDGEDSRCVAAGSQL